MADRKRKRNVPPASTRSPARPAPTATPTRTPQPQSLYEHGNSSHYSRRPNSDTSMVTVGQDFQQLDPRYAQQIQVPQQQQDNIPFRHSPRGSPIPNGRSSPRPDGRVSPHPSGRVSPHPSGRVSPHPSGRVSPHPSGRVSPRPVSPRPRSPRPSTRNSPRIRDRRSARLAMGDGNDIGLSLGDIEMGTVNPAFLEAGSPTLSPNETRRYSSDSSASYRSSNPDEDEIIERELIAANLQDPTSVIGMLPSRQLGRTLSSATSNNKWLRQRSRKSLKRGRSMSGRHTNDNIGMEMMIDRILSDEDMTDGTGRATLRRKKTIKGIQGSMETKRRVREQCERRSDKRKTKSVGWFKYWRYQVSYAWESFKESLSNLTYSFELWRDPIKKIEGNFGSGVTSYFVLLKWLLLLNIPVFIISFGFITIPQLVYQPSASQENPESFTGAEILTGEGWLTNTELYYGYYTNETFNKIGSTYWNMPVAYLFASSGYLLLIFIVLAQGMSKTYREYYITGDRSHNFYTSKVFSGWDYSITSESTSQLKQRSNYLELAEQLASHHVRRNQNCGAYCLKILLRLFMNIVVLGIIAGASYLIFHVYREKTFATDIPVIGDLAIALFVSVYNLVLPYIFSVIGYIEKYENPRTTLYFSLFRTFLMKATILIVLVYHWFNQFDQCDGNSAGALPCECWETFLGTEVYKLVIVDLIIQTLSTFFLEFIRRIGRDYFCKWFASPEFDIARNTMDLIQSQTYTWIGMFFAPLLMIICIVKLILLFYIKQLSVLYNCKPSLHPWRAGLAQTLFILILFLMYAICVCCVGYSMVNTKPSMECGPFRGLNSPFDVWTQLVNKWDESQKVWKFIITFMTTQGVVAGLIILLCLAVYYFKTLTEGRRATVKRLKQQITLEGKDKLFLLKMLQNAIKNRTSINRGASTSAEAAAAIPPPMVKQKPKKSHAKIRTGHTALSPQVQQAVDSADLVIHQSEN
ncbi:transmembrane channel-like protein 7 [Asterias amurensis]|uniref:transmembrane channel-like protein 7 n=1 Tax=Asterias amurensis TaxID=7602 RepID=UPI003AB73614